MKSSANKKKPKAEARKCMRCLMEGIETRVNGQLVEHPCSHGKTCGNKSTGGPKCAKCRAELEVYWASKRDITAPNKAERSRGLP